MSHSLNIPFSGCHVKRNTEISTSDIQAEEQVQSPLFHSAPAVTFQTHEKSSHCQCCVPICVLTFQCSIYHTPYNRFLTDGGLKDTVSKIISGHSQVGIFFEFMG